MDDVINVVHHGDETWRRFDGGQGQIFKSEEDRVPGGVGDLQESQHVAGLGERGQTVALAEVGDWRQHAGGSEAGTAVAAILADEDAAGVTSGDDRHDFL